MRFPSPCGGKVVMDAKVLYALVVPTMFPSPCGGKVVMDLERRTSNKSRSVYPSFHPLAGER